MTNKKPLVSIILPSYNGEKYISQAIDSILTQSLSDLELILVDDCSNDNTLQIMKKYAELDNRVAVIHNDHNCKLPGSLNIGISHAKGQYISWTSDDNFYHKDALKIMASTLSSEPDDTAMVTSRFKIWNVNIQGDIISEFTSEIYEENDIYLHNIVGACFLYRSEVINKIGSYDTNTFCAEDYDYWLRIYSGAGKIKFIDKVLYTYRQHPGNLSATKKKEIFIQTYKVLEKYSENWLTIYKNSPDKLTSLYYMSALSDADNTKRIRSVIKTFSPLLNRELYDFDKQDSFIIWGCGDLGQKTAKILQNKLLHFIDSNPSKAGTIINGIEVKGIESIDANRDVPIIVAVGPENMFSIINRLSNIGLKHFYTVWGLIAYENNQNHNDDCFWSYHV